jgi:hypothetical protein
MGNIETLAERILDESDWQLKSSGSILKQTVNEPLYAIQLNRNLTGYDMEDKNKTISLTAGKIVYAFYSNIINKESLVQFLYADTYEIDDDNVITNSPNWYVENISYNNEGIPDFATTFGISEIYRGKRLVRKVATKYDSTIDKYVNVYKNGNEEVYGFTETEYTSPATVRSYVTNPNSYDSYTGWEVGGTTVNGSMNFPTL